MEFNEIMQLTGRKGTDVYMIIIIYIIIIYKRRLYNYPIYIMLQCILIIVFNELPSFSNLSESFCSLVMFFFFFFAKEKINMKIVSVEKYFHE